MTYFNKKHVIVFASVCFSVLLLLQIHSIWRFSKMYVMQIARKVAVTEPLAYQCCIPMNNSIRTNVFFLKTHKTGSTTVQSVLIRFAIMNSLDAMVVRYDSYFLPFSDSSIFYGLRTPNNKYNVFAQHARYDPKMKSYQYPDTSMVTIMRHPVALFQSLYTFFRMDKSSGMTFQKFLNSPIKPTNLSGFDGDIAYRGYNQMSMDLGFDLAQSENTTAISEFIWKIDREFDFVMITEYMDESFVLLANLMGWPLEYVASLRLNARFPESEPYILTRQDELTVMDLNRIDTQLYNHFLEKFLKCMRQYGEEQLNRQVQQLQAINGNFKRRCVAEEIIGLNEGNLELLKYAPKNPSDKECFYSMQTSPTLFRIIYNEQAKRVQNSINKFFLFKVD